ncbi:hypothetical protein CQ10_34175 [Bradyrhizobium valentinum]|nr:hypothetical protein CQ10_34175 [Bradyrhizobium valentinum]
MSLSPDQRHVLLLADRTRDIGQITAAVARRIWARGPVGNLSPRWDECAKGIEVNMQGCWHKM